MSKIFCGTPHLTKAEVINSKYIITAREWGKVNGFNVPYDRETFDNDCSEFQEYLDQEWIPGVLAQQSPKIIRFVKEELQWY